MAMDQCSVLHLTEFMCSLLLVSVSLFQQDIFRKYEYISMELHVKFSLGMRNCWLEFWCGPQSGITATSPKFYHQNLETDGDTIQSTWYLFPDSKKWISNVRSLTTSRMCSKSVNELFHLPATSVQSALCSYMNVNPAGVLTPTSLCPSPPVFCFCGSFQMWTSVPKKATAARAVPTRRGGSSAGASRATSSGPTSAAAKLWVKTTVLYFNLDMWPQRVARVWPPIKTRLHSVYICFSGNCIRSCAPGS